MRFGDNMNGDIALKLVHSLFAGETVILFGGTRHPYLLEFFDQMVEVAQAHQFEPLVDRSNMMIHLSSGGCLSCCHPNRAATFMRGSRNVHSVVFPTYNTNETDLKVIRALSKSVTYF